MHYVVGLGNPGDKYQNSRHNIGWQVLDVLCAEKKLPTPLLEKKYSGMVSEGIIAGLPVLVLYPDTFMNHSGSAVKKLVPPKDAQRLIVVYDDIALPLGVVRISFGRGSGGHNGVVSIANSLGTKDFVRVRIGIGKMGFWPWEKKGVVRRPSGEALPKYVLGNFTKREQNILPDVYSKATVAIIDCITLGYDQAMNIHNQEVK
ncbi:MAG: aminoacyl-tRNA hydrolase [Candidatus Paceibacteria bacterium]